MRDVVPCVMHPCPRDAAIFHGRVNGRPGVNMTPRAIRAWARDPRATRASWAATRRRLPQLAQLKAKPVAAWTANDCRYARRVNSFNARMAGMVRTWGCTDKAVISLRNWGHQPKACKIPR